MALPNMTRNTLRNLSTTNFSGGISGISKLLQVTLAAETYSRPKNMISSSSNACQLRSSFKLLQIYCASNKPYACWFLYTNLLFWQSMVGSDVNSILRSLESLRKLIVAGYVENVLSIFWSLPLFWQKVCWHFLIWAAFVQFSWTFSVFTRWI
jgi:hypothetical protein